MIILALLSFMLYIVQISLNNYISQSIGYSVLILVCNQTWIFEQQHVSMTLKMFKEKGQGDTANVFLYHHVFQEFGHGEPIHIHNQIKAPKCHNSSAIK